MLGGSLVGASNIGLGWCAIEKKSTPTTSSLSVENDQSYNYEISKHGKSQNDIISKIAHALQIEIRTGHMRNACASGVRMRVCVGLLQHRMKMYANTTSL